MNEKIVAIDGPAGAGKSTVARRVAEALGVAHIDTGAMYRLVGLLAKGSRVPLDDGDRVAAMATELAPRWDVDEAGRLRHDGQVVGEEIRTPEVSEAASVVGAHPAVRRTLVGLQRRITPSEGAVVEGRDIGTVVWPDAAVKIYLDARPEVRSARHAGVGGDAVVAVAERDARDASRAAGPMRPAPDAVIVETSDLDVDAVVARVLTLARCPSPQRPDLLYRSLRALFAGLLHGPFRLEVTGTEHMPSRGPGLLAPNHRSLIDHFVVAALTKRKVWFMGKEELFSSPVAARLLSKLGAFPVRRGRPDRSALNRALELLAAGELLGIYPEGTRRPTSRFEEVEEGFAYIALKSGAPVIPVAISGSEAVFPRDRKLPRLVKVRVRIGPAFILGGPTQGVLPRRTIREATAVAQKRLSGLIDKLEPR